jgi:hypothetical protein
MSSLSSTTILSLFFWWYVLHALRITTANSHAPSLMFSQQLDMLKSNHILRKKGSLQSKFARLFFGPEETGIMPLLARICIFVTHGDEVGDHHVFCLLFRKTHSVTFFISLSHLLSLSFSCDFFLSPKSERSMRRIFLLRHSLTLIDNSHLP